MFLTSVLPFGAAASVYSFKRLSTALQTILQHYLKALATCFYDDFPMIEPAGTASVLSKAITACLDCLGWKHAKLSDKAIDFAAEFHALGISVQLKDLHKGLLFVQQAWPSREALLHAGRHRR